jgi:PST family polysaccharide transporter
MIAVFITGGMINRSLGPGGRGVLAEMQTWVGLFIVIFGVSIDTATYHFANKDVYSNDNKTKFVTVFLLNIIYAFLATISLMLFVFYKPQAVSSKTLEFLFLLDIYLIVLMLAANLTVFFQALGDIKFSALIGITQAVINIMIVSVGFFLGFINIRFVIVSMIISQFVALIMIFRTSFKAGFGSGKFSMGMARILIITGLKQHMSTIATFMYIKMNQLIVFRYSGEGQAGIFAVPLALASYLMIIPGTFQAALYPRVIHFRDDFEITVKAIRLGFYVWGSIAIFIMLCARPIILIYAGNSFAESVNVFRILMIAVWFLPLSSFVAPYYVKKGVFGIAAIFAIFIGIISMGLNMWLVPKYASIGAAIATASTCLIGFCSVLLFFYIISKKNPLVIFKPAFKEEAYFIKQAYLGMTK